MKKLILNIPLGLFLLLLLIHCQFKQEKSPYTKLGSKLEKARSILNFGKEWKFYLGDALGADASGFDDSMWRKLNLPHDWSIEGEFSDKHPASPGGGALPGGIGWYRKMFNVSPEELKGTVFIDFDGVYQNSEVWINGHSVGKRFYGYSSFRYELTPFLVAGDNVISVKVDNSAQPNSRWYSGSGIYRNVWLVTTGKTHIAHWGTFVSTPKITDTKAKVKIETKIRNNLSEDQELFLETVILDPSGNEVASGRMKTDGIKDSIVNSAFDFDIPNPILWNLDVPKLYSAVSMVYVDGDLVDNYTTPFGIRSFKFDAEKGFSLNGKSLKINGVCNHHDLGCLGSAINKRALERQIEILKGMGCNAIRTSHNPPAPELLDLADQMGMIIMDEAFDMWKKPKNKFDYSTVWDEMHKKDLQDMILRDRNHPSVMIWSIGNEILEQWDRTGIALAKELAGYVRELDTTRPITSATNEPRPHNYIIRSGVLDLIGYNYHHNDFASFPETFPGQKFIGAETVSALMTRGVYDMPSEEIRRWPAGKDWKGKMPNADNTCSSYDNVSTPWGSTHEETMKVIKKHNYLSGQFIWTGFDYLGEPTPYWWPSRSSYFGIVDLAGFPKDVYYMYQSEWTNKDVLHIFPHWNWDEGQVVDIWAYSNAEEVELFLNNNSLGVQKKQGDDLHLMWKVPYTPGTLKAISRTDGKEILVQEVKTAGVPAKLVVTADRSAIKADGSDLSFLTIDVVDANGVIVPNADNLVEFRIEGSGAIVGVDNGDPVSHESFKAKQRKAFHGKCLVVIQSGELPGIIKLTASSHGLPDSGIEIITN
ncbi:MAG TPA: glycoside hydrolase family 2 [Prolixibacteraceae bacterium]|nr:glycoside hydrolase family 2 [Prolixibacteraceae bacterium]